MLTNCSLMTLLLLTLLRRRPIAIALVTLLLASFARSDDFHDVRYEIHSTLEQSTLSLSECATVRFELGPILPETLFFWQIELEANMVAIMDSIRVNSALVYMGPLSSENRGKNDTNESVVSNDLLDERSARRVYLQASGEDENGYVIPITAAKSMLPNITNEIQFYYRLLFNEASEVSGITFPGAIPYFEFYPRLAKSTDRFTSLDQRYNSVEEFRLQVLVPADFHLLSEPEPDSMVEVNNHKVYYLPHYFASQIVWFAIRDAYYRLYESDGHLLHIYLDPMQTPNEDLIFEFTSSLNFYKSVFGSLPYSRYNLMIIPLSGDITGAAIANFILTGNYGSSGSLNNWTARLFRRNQTAVPHEVAHLWWGCRVSIIDQWFGEAMASFWSRRYQIERSGGQAIPYPDDDLYQLLNRISFSPSTMGLVDDDPASAGYYKGPHILEMLALEIGEDKMASICRQYYEQFQGREASFSQFREMLTRDSPESETFLAHWVDSGHTQNISISNVASKPTGDCFENELALQRTGGGYSRIPVILEYEGGAKEIWLLHPDSLSKTWNSEGRLQSVHIDPENLLLETRRADNGWPRRLKIYAPTLNPLTNIGNAVEFMFYDAPYYHLITLPCLVSHTDMFGWSYSVLLVGREEIIYGSPLRGRKIFVARTGYNSRMNSLAGSLYWYDIITDTDGTSLYYSLKTGQENGQQYAGVGAGISFKSVGCTRPYSETSFSLYARKFSALSDVSSVSWPTRETYPFSAEWSFEGANTDLLRSLPLQSKLRIDIGLPMGNKAADYNRKEWHVQFDAQILDFSFMLGSVRGRVAQERFDLSQEGRLLSLPPFKHYYTEILRLNASKGIDFLSQFRMNIFTNYVNDLNGDNWLVESGLGIRFGQELWVETSFPLYSDFRGIEQDRWDWRRLRIRASLFVSEPIFDFRIR